MRLSDCLLAVAAVIVFSASTLTAHADTYTYTGNNFTAIRGSETVFTTDDSVSGSFTVSTPLAANTTYDLEYATLLSFRYFR
jgi:hypothetical protein